MSAKINQVATALKVSNDEQTRETTKRNANPNNNINAFRETEIAQIQQQADITKWRDADTKANIPKDSIARRLNLGLTEWLRSRANYPDTHLVRDISNGGIYLRMYQLLAG